MKRIEELAKFAEKLSEQSGVSLFSVYCNSKEEELQISVVDEKDAACALAAIMATALRGDGDKGMLLTAKILLNAFKLVLEDEDLERIILGRIEKKANESGCEDCDLVRTCMEEDAITYRKKNHIPRPKRKNDRRRKINID